jgi:hypothetical protein
MVVRITMNRKLIIYKVESTRVEDKPITKKDIFKNKDVMIIAILLKKI